MLRFMSLHHAHSYLLKWLLFDLLHRLQSRAAAPTRLSCIRVFHVADGKDLKVLLQRCVLGRRASELTGKSCSNVMHDRGPRWPAETPQYDEANHKRDCGGPICQFGSWSSVSGISPAISRTRPSMGGKPSLQGSSSPMSAISLKHWTVHRLVQ